jgi:hypothetical protein
MNASRLAVVTWLLNGLLALFRNASKGRALSNSSSNKSCAMRGKRARKYVPPCSEDRLPFMITQQCCHDSLPVGYGVVGFGLKNMVGLGGPLVTTGKGIDIG